MKVKVLVMKVHKWLGLIIGIQILLWIVGGLVMSYFPIEQVHGDHLHQKKSAQSIELNNLFSLEELVKESELQISAATILNGFAGPQYRLKDMDRKYHYYDAQTGLKLPSLSQQQAEEIANSIYTLDSKILSITKITESSTEYRRRLPVWRVEYNDDEASTFYIAIDNGQLMSVRNNVWRLFDFVWMLHIMDYKNREDFNHLLLIVSSLLALLVALSGIYLVFKTFKKKDFKLG